MEKQEKVFAEGFMFKMKPDSPEWVVGSLSLKSVMLSHLFRSTRTKDGLI